MFRDGPANQKRLPVVVDASVLCTACGLCCTGALFSHAPIRDDEVELAADLGLSVAEPPGAGRVFGLPCPALDGTRCGVYPRRPAVCGEFECELLRSVKRGGIALAPAIARVEAVRGVLSAIAREQGGAFDPAAIAAVKRGQRSAPDPEAYAREHATLLELAERLSMLLRADFYAIG